MSDSMTRYTPDELLAERTWLARLAGVLAQGDAVADDWVQDTCVAALVHPPRRSRSPRPWLAKVLRNVARMCFRREGRRLERETSFVTDPSELPDVAASVEHTELLDEVVHLALLLTEPYRSTLFLYYFEGIRTPEIARRLGVPEGTVRWRIKEALDQIRAGLGADKGPRRVWRSLIPWRARHHQREVSPRAAATSSIGPVAIFKIGAAAICSLALATSFGHRMATRSNAGVRPAQPAQALAGLDVFDAAGSAAPTPSATAPTRFAFSVGRTSSGHRPHGAKKRPILAHLLAAEDPVTDAEPDKCGPCNRLNEGVRLYDAGRYEDAADALMGVTSSVHCSPYDRQKAEFWLAKALYNRKAYEEASVPLYGIAFSGARHPYWRSALAWIVSLLDALPPSSVCPAIATYPDDVLDDAALAKVRIKVRTLCDR